MIRVLLLTIAAALSLGGLLCLGVSLWALSHLL